MNKLAVVVLVFFALNTQVSARNCVDARNAFAIELRTECSTLTKCYQTYGYQDRSNGDPHKCTRVFAVCRNQILDGYSPKDGELRKYENIIFGQGYRKELESKCKKSYAQLPQKTSKNYGYVPTAADYEAFGQASLTKRLPLRKKVSKVRKRWSRKKVPERRIAAHIVQSILWPTASTVGFRKAKSRRSRRRQAAVSKRAESRKAFAKKQFAKRKPTASKRRARRKAVPARQAHRKVMARQRSNARIRQAQRARQKIRAKKRITRRRKTRRRIRRSRKRVRGSKRSRHRKRPRARRRARRSVFKEAFGFAF